jgi:hypothetical protein
MEPVEGVCDKRRQPPRQWPIDALGEVDTDVFAAAVGYGR